MNTDSPRQRRPLDLQGKEFPCLARLLRRRLELIAFWIFPVVAFPPLRAPAQATALPATINEVEGPFAGVWTLKNGQYNAVWNNGAVAVITVQSFTTTSVIFNRTDTSASVSAGLTAVYTGQISSAGNSIVNGRVTWTWPGVAGYPATGTWTATWAASATPPASARIFFTGGADITNTPQDAVVGQQIALTGSVESLPAGVTVETQAWDVQGNTVGGFQASNQSGQVQATDFTKADTVFYWIAPSSTVAQEEAVTFTAMLSDGSMVTASTAFNLVGPDSTDVNVTTGKVHILPLGNFVYLRKLRFGRLVPGQEGIIEQAATNSPANDDGALLWVQVVNEDTSDFERGSETLTCASTPGLDLNFPYTTGAEMDDSPYIALAGPTFEPNSISRNFAARTYLMWDPLLPSGCTAPKPPFGVTVCSSIPVPLGYVDWGFTATAIRMGRDGWAPSGGPDPATPEFVGTDGSASALDFPYWTMPEQGAPSPCP